MEIGERIREKRKELKLTQKELGKLSKIAEPNIRKYELGKQNPKFETLEKIASGLGVTAHYLQTGYEDSYEEMIETSRIGIEESKENILSFVNSHDENTDYNDLHYVSEFIDILNSKNLKIKELNEALHKEISKNKK